MNVAVIGMGKIGLPLAINFALHHKNVIGVDVQEEVVDKINNGIEPFPGEHMLEERLKKVISEGSLTASTNLAFSISTAEVIVVCIPLMLDENGNPEFTNMDDLVTKIGRTMKVGTLICFETTLPVGTSRNRFTAILEVESSLLVGTDFNVVFSPERVLTGRIFHDLGTYPKLVGGVTHSCTTRGVEFYESVIDSEKRDDLSKPNGVWAMENAEAAEFAKIAETTFRDVNIGLANEFAIYAKKYGIDIYKVIEAANSQPFSHIHTPGIAVGGHCIPVYPKFYTWNNAEAQIVEAARQRNLNMPSRAVNQIIEAIGSIAGMNIGILGITYRPGVKEVALSGAITLLKLLKNEGATVFGDDPLLTREEIISLGFDGAGVPNEIAGIILQTSHSEYEEFDFMGRRNLQFFYDGRNAFPYLSEQMNFTYLSL